MDDRSTRTRNRIGRFEPPRAHACLDDAGHSFELFEELLARHDELGGQLDETRP